MYMSILYAILQPLIGRIFEYILIKTLLLTILSYFRAHYSYIEKNIHTENERGFFNMKCNFELYYSS